MNILGYPQEDYLKNYKKYRTDNIVNDTADNHRFKLLSSAETKLL